jgi:hypothetical protein
MKTLIAPLDAAKPRPILNFTQRLGVRASIISSPLRMENWKQPFLVALLLVPSLLSAQQYSIDWYKIAGGGGTSTNGSYSVSGTIGQPDASGAMSGGNYAVTGGFWALINVVQTAGLPNLIISHSGNSVIVSWPNTGSYTLHQNSNLANGSGWTTSGYSITTANGTNSITITPLTGNLFFRLSNP